MEKVALVAIRDRYLSAKVMGVNVWGYRIPSFGVLPLPRG